ncbi:unnamed protein product [Taenia asiatica]|uniref:Spatacsin_C domain-containing protein n=1 Tax=Taenia asiatica TaxID=60517 RepID=A0A0R3VX96_TAEAS|nr:unnamed protein product [Taenia asiatica]
MRGVAEHCEVSKHSVKVLDSEAGIPSHHLIALEAVKRHFGPCEVCCVRLADQRDLIAVAKLDETILDVFVPCNAPAAPSSISWTAEHLVHRLLPPSSFNRPLTDAISSHLHRQLDEGSVRLRLMNDWFQHNGLFAFERQITKFKFHLVFLDADCRPLFVTAQRGFMDAFEFDTVMLERRQTRGHPRRLASSIVRSGRPFPIMETFDLPDPGISTDTDDQCIFLWGITKLVFQRHWLPRNNQLALTTALVVHNSNSFVDRIYLLIFLAFAYPLFGATPSFISYLQIGDVSADLFWNEIVHLVLQRNSRLSFLSSRTENAVLCEIELFIRQFGLCRVWQGCDCHPLEAFLRDQSDFNDPLVIGVLRTCLLPYMSHDVDISKLLSVDCLTEIMLSSSVCRAFADYHPRTIVALFENTNLVKCALRSCDHLHTLLGESKAEDWIYRVFSLYQLCSEQVGIFGTSLRVKWGMDWHIADCLLSRLERQSLDIDDGDDGRVPKLTQLSRRALRFALRQYLDGLPPPRPSFTAQIEALKGSSSAIKGLILAKVEDS